MNGGGWDGAGISAMSWVVRFSFSAAVSWGWRGRSHGHLSGWWVGAPGPTSVAALLPGALGTTEAGRLDFPGHLAATAGGSGSSGSVAAAGEHDRGAASALPSVPPPLCVPVYPPLRTVWDSPHPGVLGRGTSVLLCMFMFTGCGWKGETKAAFRSSFSSGSSFMSRIC